MRRILLRALVPALLVASTASAQTYPEKPVRVLITSTAGGPLDVFTRLVAEKMAEQLKQPVVVEARPGANGNIAAQAVAKATPDGYTLLSIVDPTFTVSPALYKQVPFDPEKDFRIISLMATFGQMVAVNPALPVNSIKELAALSKTRDLKYASAGNGAPSHLSFEYLLSAADIRATHIPYKGNPPALIALLNGEVDMVMVISTSVLSHMKSGKMRAIGYSDTKRSLVAPDVPTIEEQGYRGFNATFGYALVAPAATPDAIVQTLHTAAVTAVNAPEVTERLRTFDVSPTRLSPAESAAWLRAGRERWGTLVRQLKVTPD